MNEVEKIIILIMLFFIILTLINVRINLYALIMSYICKPITLLGLMLLFLFFIISFLIVLKKEKPK